MNASSRIPSRTRPRRSFELGAYRAPLSSSEKRQIAILAVIIGPIAALFVAVPFIRFLAFSPPLAFVAAGALVLAGLVALVAYDHRVHPAGELTLLGDRLRFTGHAAGPIEVAFARVTKALIVTYGDDRPAALVIWHGRARLVIHAPRLGDATLEDVLTAVASALAEAGGAAATEAFDAASHRAVRFQVRLVKIAAVATVLGMVVALTSVIVMLAME